MVGVYLYIEVDAEIMMDGGGECIDHSAVEIIWSWNYHMASFGGN